MTKKKVVLLEDLSQEELIAKINDLEKDKVDLKSEVKKLKNTPKEPKHSRVHGMNV